MPSPCSGSCKPVAQNMPLPGLSMTISPAAARVHRRSGFVSRIPAPLGIDKITLDDGSSVSGFLCEQHAIDAAGEVTRFGGWRAYINRGATAEAAAAGR